MPTEPPALPPDPDKPLLVRVVPERRRWTAYASEYAPIFISMLALLVSAWTAYETSSNLRLSHQPAAGLVRGLMDDGKLYGIHARNDGMGVAAIGEVRIYVDGHRVAKLALVAVGYPEIERYGRVGWFEPSDLGLRPGATMRLLWVEDDRGDHVRNFASFILERTFVAAKACNVYRECRTICTTDARIPGGSCEQIEKMQAGKAAVPPRPPG